LIRPMWSSFAAAGIVPRIYHRFEPSLKLAKFEL
jgi:hypothetical protein